MADIIRNLRVCWRVDFRAKRLECVELAPAFEPPQRYESASKLDALQTLRALRLPLGQAGRREHPLAC
jgi:hypothetical protein